jgi:predicted ATPase
VRRDPTFHPDENAWPVSVPAVAQLFSAGMELAPGLTVLVGENGSGKSTLIELLAEAYGLNPQGGSRSVRFQTRPTEPEIGKRLELERGALRPRWAFFVRADTASGLYTYYEEIGAPEPAYHELSHGEGFIALLQAKTNDAGFYLLDEPDGPLSFTSSLGVIAMLRQLVAAGSQIVLATHSPLIAATPGATILELGEHGMRPTAWENLELVHAWRRFLEDPGSYFRYLLDEE